MSGTIKEQAEWSAEFEQAGEEKVRSWVDAGRYPGPKSEFAVRWLGREVLTRRTREKKTYNYAHWTLFWALIVGVAGIIVGLIAAWPIIKGWLG
jgi:hypothetical protein